MQGKGEEKARQILEDALAVQKAGAYMCVLECVPPKLAGLITKHTEMVTIGIGAGKDCDGQVLVRAVAFHIGFFCGGEAFVLYGSVVALIGVNHGLPDFSEMADKFWIKFHVHSQEILADENLTVTEESYVKSDCSDEYLAELDREATAKEERNQVL